MELGSFYTSVFAHFNSINSHLLNIIDSFKEQEEILRNNTFDNQKGYILIVNRNNKSKFDDDISTARKNISIEGSLNENTEKMNKSIR